MKNHITGPLTVGEAAVDTETGIQEIIINATVDGKECYPFVAIEFKSAPGMQQDNARRLVACWNACEGTPDRMLTPEAMISMGVKLVQLAAQSERLKAINAELVEALLPAQSLLQQDRDSLAEAHTDSAGRIDKHGVAALAEYDKALAPINAAIKATS